MPRRDTKPLAKAILARFGSLAEAMNAPDDLLLEVPELGDAAVTEIKLVQAAAQYGGKLSVTQGVMATGKSFEEVERALDEMVKSGYVDVTNDENTGVVVYNFGQLEASR